jgi:formylglycine-generating enzyme required for sulfatase activity
LFAPNKLGLYDMHGNVAEWCDDKAQWLNTESRLLHTGGWNDSAAGGRTSRIEAPPENYTYYDLGFRVARVPVKP